MANFRPSHLTSGAEGRAEERIFRRRKASSTGVGKLGSERLLDSKSSFYIKIMVEPLLSGIVLGLVPITIIGLFVTAYLQYKRGDRLL